MTTQRNITPKSQRKSVTPGGMAACRRQGADQTDRQAGKYCRRAIGISRFCYNLAVATHRFHRINRLPWPSWQDIYKAFNACKREDYPFVTEAASRVAEGAFMDFGRAIANWRNPNTRTRAPKFKRWKLTGTGSFRANQQELPRSDTTGSVGFNSPDSGPSSWTAHCPRASIMRPT